MSWATVYEATLAVDPSTEPITLTGDFEPYYRLIVTAELLTGLGIREPFLGYIRQLLIVPGIGEVKGRTMALMPMQQLFIPSTELPYKLVYQPIQRDFSLKLTIQVESSIVNSGGTADNGPVLAAIAALAEQLGDGPGQGESTDYLPLFNQVLSGLGVLGNELSALSTEVSALATNPGNGGSVTVDLSPIETTLGSISSQLDSIAATEAQILAAASTPTPSALGVPYSLTQSSEYGGAGTGDSLTDGNSTTGTINYPNGQPGWIQANFPYTVVVRGIKVSAGNLQNVGPIADRLNGAKVQYSNDGTNWIDLATINGVADSGVNQSLIFPFTNPVVTKKCRIYRADGHTAVTEMKFI
jgi:hypothetical protein